jgi:Amt family ammonium transporter
MGTLVVWTILDMIRQQRSTAVGAATAIVVGLVAITPAAGFVGPMSAIALGAIAAVPSYFALVYRAKTQLDDSLDVVAAHGVGGTVGALLTGVFAQKGLNGVADGLLFGNPAQLGIQFAAVAAAIVYSGVVSFALLKLIGAVIPLRADSADETTGLDVTQHGEEAYIHERGITAPITEVRPKETAGGYVKSPVPSAS